MITVTVPVSIPKDCYEVLVHNFVEAHLLYPEPPDEKKRNEVLKALNLGVFKEMEPALLEMIEKGDLEKRVLSDVRTYFGLYDEQIDINILRVSESDRKKTEHELTCLFYMILKIVNEKTGSISEFLSHLPSMTALKKKKITLMSDKDYRQALKKYRHLLPFVMGKVLSNDFFESRLNVLWEFKGDKLSLLLSAIIYFEKTLTKYDQALWDKRAYEALGVKIDCVVGESLPIEEILSFYCKIVKNI